MDMYSDENFSPPTDEQVAVMNANGWYQTAGAGDMGHFEYIGNQSQDAAAVSPLTSSIINGRM